MASKVVHVSDLSGDLIADEAQHCKLVIQAHPRYNGRTGLPVELDCTTDELDGVKGAEVVIVEKISSDGQRSALAILLADFDGLADGGLDDVIQEALRLQRGSRAGGVPAPAADRPHPRRKAPAGTGKTAAYYATIEHAGEPHVGKVMPGEAAVVRDNLDQVNARLREHELREIDAGDPKMRVRYGLDDPTDAPS